MDDWSEKEELGGTLRRSKRLPAKRKHKEDSISQDEVEKKRSKESISSKSSSVSRARPSASQSKASLNSSTSTGLKTSELGKSGKISLPAGCDNSSGASKSSYNLRPRLFSNLSNPSTLSTRKKNTIETGQTGSSRSEAATAGAEPTSGALRRTRNSKLDSATSISQSGAAAAATDSQVHLQTRAQRRSLQNPVNPVPSTRNSHLLRGRSASQQVPSSSATGASKPPVSTRVRASSSFTSRLFRNAEPAKASGSSILTTTSGAQPLAPLRNSVSAHCSKAVGDQPEPESLRRSHRFREATGSCASSSNRRGSQTKKRSWTRRQSPSMSTDDGAPTQASTSEQRSDESQGASGSSGGGSGGDSASGPDDGDLSRLQALLEARGLPPHLFGTLGPRVHQLLHRTISGSSVSKAQQLLSGIQSSSDEGQQLQSVIEMCQLLVMGNEETLGGFPVKQAVPALINLLSMEHNFDMMNHACRALTYLMEALPRSTIVVVDAIPVFLEKLQVIQCMDVAEQSLTALEMLSRRHGKAILQAGGLSACLLYLDFFSISAQRSALAIASNCCPNLSHDEFHFVADSIAILSGRLQHQDKKSVESCCLAFTRLVDNFQNDEKRLEELAAHGLLSNLQQLLIVSPPVISTGTFVMVLRMLAIMCANCPSLGVQLLKQNIADTLRYLLMGTTELGEEDLVELVPRSPQEFYEITCLISELMPNLPSEGLFSVDSLLSNTQKCEQGLWQWRDDRGVWHNYSWIDSRIIEAAHQSGEDELSLTTMGRTYTVDFNTMQQINEDTGTTRPVQRRPASSETCTLSSQSSVNKKEDERALLLQEETELVTSFTTALFSVLYEIYNSSVGPAVRHKCINAILRMIYYTPPDLLSVILKKHPISSLISAMLGSNDLRVLVNALQMAEILMQKLPDIFHVYFRREGVMHRAKDLVNNSLNGPVALGKELNSSSSETISSDPRAGEIFPGSSRFDSLPSPPPTRRLGDMLKRKRRSKRVGRPKGKCPSPSEESPVCGKRYSSTDSSSTKSFSLPSSSSFQSSKPSLFPSLTTTKWSTRSSSSSLCSGSSERSRLDMSNSGIQPSTSQTSDNKEKAKSWVKDQAKKFCAAYFDEQRGASHPALEILNRLSAAADELSPDKDTGLTPLKEISKVLSSSGDGASAFEILHSGFVPKLLRYLTTATAENSLPVNLRLKRFLHVFLDCPEPSVTGSTVSLDDGHEKPALVALVQKLHLCINQLEQFPVKVHDAPGTASGAGGSRGSQTLKFFNTHQIKCHLQRHPDCQTLKQWKGGPVKIDPLALVQAIEKYLVVRGYSRVREVDADEDASDDEGSEDEIDETLATELQGNNPQRHEIEILLGDRVLPYNMTVYQAVKQFGQCDEERDAEDDHGVLGRPSIWVATHTIWYRQISETSNPSAGGKKTRSDSKSPRKTSPKTKAGKSEHTTKQSALGCLNGKLSNCSIDSFSISDPSLEVICLMRVLFTLNMQWSVLYEVGESRAIVSCNEFVNHKLTAKVLRQLQDPIIVMTGNFPPWLNEIAKSCPFLFPFECRQQLFFCTAFDRDRAMGKLQETVPDLMNTDGTDRVTPRLDRKKRSVTRKNLFNQSETIINDLGTSRSILEIQYEGEVGTGLGPTLEFYALVSKEFQRADKEMWRGETTPGPESSDVDEGVLYVYSPTGLFPVPLPRNAKVGLVSKLRSRFRFLGKFMAKAMTDFRMIDIPLSKAFYKWMLGHESSLGYRDLQYVDPLIYRTINQLQEVVKQKKRLEQDSSHTQESLELALDNLTLDGVTIEDLCLEFVLPGFPNIELKRGGKDIQVTIYNLEEYIKAVVDWTLVEGVSRQFQAFREGFDSVFQLSNLSSFYSNEMDLLLCGTSGEKWDVKNLMESCRPDHGYTHDSRAVKFLFEILSSYNTEEQRLFLQFVTGSPRLPVGGFRSLNPPLTIVRKTFEAPLCADNYLPSVMTCVNYLKLPDYSTKEIMDSKLEIAAREGQRSFHLS